MREAKLQPLLDDLEGRFDTLRDDLLDALDEYEGQLKDQCQSLPQWLDLRFGMIWPLFKFGEDDLAPQGALGPRVVAIAAGWLQEHVECWVGSQGQTITHVFVENEALVAKYKGDLKALAQDLEGVMLQGEDVAAHARGTLAQWRDDILVELEDERMQDIDAIERLVAEGSLEPGRDARQEIAQLWEEQRHMASALLRGWEPFDSLVSRGLEMARDGVEALQNLMEQMHDGMLDVYPPLDDGYTGQSIIPTSSKTDPFLSEHSDGVAVRDSGQNLFLMDNSAADDFDPYGSPSASGDEQEDEMLPFEFDNNFNDTPLSNTPPPPIMFEDVDEHDPGPTLPMMFADDDFSDDDVEMTSAPMIDFGPQTSHTSSSMELDWEDEEEEVITPPTPERPPRKLPRPTVDTPAPSTQPIRVPLATPKLRPRVENQDAGPTLVPSAMQQPAPPEPLVETLLTVTKEQLNNTDSTAAKATPEAQRPSVKTPEQPAPTAPAKPTPPAKKTASRHVSAGGPTPIWIGDGVQTVVKRVLDQLEPLGRLTFIVAFALPLIVVLGTLAVALASRLDSSLPNPLLPSPNLVHVIGFALLMWLVACPWILRWQITWKGWKPSLWHNGQILEETDLLLDEQGLEIADDHLLWSEVESWSVHKWDDLETDMRGWVIELTQGRRVFAFSAMSRDDESWRALKLPLAPTPSEAWRTGEQTFKRLAQALDVEL